MKKHKKNSSGLKQCQFYVEGMHCSSCEILLEKKLLKQPDIQSVDASLKDNKVIINYQGNQLPDIKKLNEEFKEQGYTFTNYKIRNHQLPLIYFKNGDLFFNAAGFKRLLLNAIVVVLLIWGFLLFNKLQLGKFISTDQSTSLPTFLLLGVVAGLSSCAALIGGLLLSLIKQWNELYITENRAQKAQPHLLFHLGRLISFFILGGVLGLIGQNISLNNVTFFSILTILISAMMLILALQMLGVHWASKLQLTAPKFITRFAADETNFKGKYMPFLTGVLTFFLPCGFTLVAQAAALASGSVFKGSMIMFLFALGTLPTLLAISYTGLAFNTRPHLTAKFNLLAGYLIIFFVIFNVNAQLNVLNLPSFSDLKLQRSVQNYDEAEFAQINEKGQQVIKVTAKGFSYTATSSTKLKKAVPVLLVVDNQGIEGCAAFMAAKGLFAANAPLSPGLNFFEFTPEQAGNYKLTCTMGMIEPINLKVI